MSLVAVVFLCAMLFQVPTWASGSSNFTITSTGPFADGSLAITVTLRDETGGPLFVTASDIRAVFDGNAVRLYLSPPASDPQVEAQNTTALSEGRINDRRYDHWNAIVGPKGAGTHTFSVVVNAGVNTYQSSFSLSSGGQTLDLLANIVMPDPPPYNGFPNIYFSGVGSLGLNSQEFNPGSTVIASVSLNSAYWASSAYISCSFADPTKILVDG